MHKFSRREVILGLSGAVVLAGYGTASATPDCVVRPGQTEGPYFVDERLNRSDIRAASPGGLVKAGTPLLLAFNVSQIAQGTCPPLNGAQIDVWQCDAAGIYSDVTDPAFKTTGQKFLRGYQMTNASGSAGFTTIYPGWYEGRTVHIHFKIRTNPSASAGRAFTSQIYFDDALTDRVHRAPAYSKPGRRTRNEEDPIFLDGGSHLLLPAEPTPSGYAGTFNIGLIA